MQDNDKVYGFIMTLFEFPSTVRTLWETVLEFTIENRQFLASDNAVNFIFDDGGKTYNMCHCINFEIADMEFWRGEAYSAYFDHLNRAGGFYYERWGDAPVHSLAAALFLSKNKLHFFNDIGYRHTQYLHCPQKELHDKGNVDYDPHSCLWRYGRIFLSQ
ncbi:glycosyltransferase family 15 protein [Sphaerobolus stellatus SS14]|uniref:Glycosyltransferase family 15 protein n=1 Tax=Sphaerobolus stellatus (strain SS14) TaxID=990650 RepID=A0A0C9TH70_SPHS4|nr:glycosyltransferase family 15 protein [Sphaerobolus stellatus SS14]